MSDLSGERSQKSHGGSSLSIFSAVGTSSPSGTSDIGHVNAEELTDNSLAVLVEDASKAVRRLELETQMFTGVVTNNILKFHGHSVLRLVLIEFQMLFTKTIFG